MTTRTVSASLDAPPAGPAATTPSAISNAMRSAAGRGPGASRPYMCRPPLRSPATPPRRRRAGEGTRLLSPGQDTLQIPFAGSDAVASASPGLGRGQRALEGGPVERAAVRREHVLDRQ